MKAETRRKLEMAKRALDFSRAHPDASPGVIPIEESLLYVQPLYLQAEGGRIPELKRVVVAYENQVVMAETLDGALAELFGGASGPGRQPPVTAAEEAPSADTGFRALTAEARRRYETALQKQRELETELRRLGETLERMQGGGSERPR